MKVSGCPIGQLVGAYRVVCMADEDLRVLGGRYEVHNRLARGGMAQVYLARDQMLDRPVAVKELVPEFAVDPTFVERFRREAQAAAGLAHANIVGVYDWGTHDGTYFIVMEYIDGPSLSQVIRRDGPLHPRRAAEITSDVAAALGFAHARGIVHRDVKPGNVLLTASGDAKVTDFGIARALSSVDEDLTQTGSVMGTATYFAPEQAQGLPVDARSDLYSLGVVFYEMATGRTPFTGDSPLAIAYKHVQDDPPAPNTIIPDLPDPVNAIIMKLLRKDPAERYASAEDLRADLARYARGEPTNAERDMMAWVAGAIAATAAVETATVVQPSVEPQPEELEDHEPTKSRTTWFLAGLFVLLALLAGFLFWLANGLSESQVTVPDVIGLNIAEARETLEDVDFEVEVVDDPESDVEPGLVTDQDPRERTEADKGSTVVLTVSGEPEVVAVPDISNMPETEAQRILTEHGLRWTVESIEDPDREPGVVSGQDPAPGTEVEVDSAVKMYVSKGAGEEIVPDLSGSTLSSAQSELQRLGFLVGGPVEESSSSVSSGRVIRTDPAAGSSVDKGSTVTVVVSSGSRTVSVPDVRNQEEATAVQTLSNRGLNSTVATQTVPPGDPAVGRVLSQNPTGGTSVAVGSTVKLLVGVAGSTTSSSSSTTTSSP